MTTGIALAIVAAVLAIAGFALRERIRRFYAPPWGLTRIRATYAMAVATSAAGVAMGSDRPIAGLALFLGGPAIALVAGLLRRDAVNRARGLPADWHAIPARSGPARRLVYALMGIGCAIAAAWYVRIDGDRLLHTLHVLWVLVPLAVTLLAAALTGRGSERLRRHLGAHAVLDEDELARDARERQRLDAR